MSSFLTQYVGNTTGLWQIVTDTSIDFTGATGVVIRMVNTQTRAVKIDDAAATVVSAQSLAYQRQPADVDTPGTYDIIFKATLTSGEQFVSYPAICVKILPLPEEN